MIDNKVVEITGVNGEKCIRELLDSSHQEVKRLFALAYDNIAGNNHVSDDSPKKYFFPNVAIKSCNIEIDGRNFYDQAINDSVKQYDEVRKLSTGQGDDCTTGCLLDYKYFKGNYKLLAADLSKQKALGADSRAIQQIIFTGKISSSKYTNNNLLHSWTIKSNNAWILQINNKNVVTSKVNIKLSDTQIKKLRMSLKMFDGNNLPHELLLTKRQKTKFQIKKHIWK